MFVRLLLESFRRQRRRKALAGIAILLGTTAITAMLALATTIGDRIHKELAVYGANIVITPTAEQLSINIGGIDIKPTTRGAYLHEADLAKLKTIFWANNITGVSPELETTVVLDQRQDPAGAMRQIARVPAVGLWFHRQAGGGSTSKDGPPALHPLWKVDGRWPDDDSGSEIAIGSHLEDKLLLSTANPLTISGQTVHITGVISAGDSRDDELLLPLSLAQKLADLPDAVSRVEVSARTKPEDAFARVDPDTLSAKQHEIWYCRPYANSIAYQIREAIPGADAQQIRRVEQTEGTVLTHISGLMWLIAAAALLAAGFAVSAAMATAVLERRAEIGLMRSLGAGEAAIALLFYTETGILAVLCGVGGYAAGSAVAAWLGGHIFNADNSYSGMFNPVLLPVVVAVALTVALAGSTPSIRSALRMEPAAVLRADA